MARRRSCPQTSRGSSACSGGVRVASHGAGLVGMVVVVPCPRATAASTCERAESAAACSLALRGGARGFAASRPDRVSLLARARARASPPMVHGPWTGVGYSCYGGSGGGSWMDRPRRLRTCNVVYVLNGSCFTVAMAYWNRPLPPLVTTNVAPRPQPQSTRPTPPVVCKWVPCSDPAPARLRLSCDRRVPIDVHPSPMCPEGT